MPPYNPSKYIVAGRTGSQIDAAKKRAVKGGSRKRCKKGKSCGATCIFVAKVCMVDLPLASLSQGLTKLSKEIQSKSGDKRGNTPTSLKTPGSGNGNPPPSTTIKTASGSGDRGGLKDTLKEMRSLYAEIAKLNNGNLPSGEIDWRVKEISPKIDSARKRAKDAINKLPSGKEKALAGLKKIEERLAIGSLRQTQITARADTAMKDLASYRARLVIAKLDAKTTQEELDKLTEKIKKVEVEARKYIGAMKAGQAKDVMLRNVNIMTGKLKTGDPGTLDATSKVAKEFMGKYKERTDGILDRISKLNAAAEKLRAVLSGETDQQKRLKIMSSLFPLRAKILKAEKEIEAIMGEMRKELLKTKLSDDDIAKFLSKVEMKGDTSLHAQIKGQLEEFARMFNGKGFMEMEVDGSYTGYLKRITADSSERAYHDRGRIMTNGISRTLFHEMGHVVEVGRSWLLQYAIDWRNSRAFTLDQISQDRNLDQFSKKPDGTPVPVKKEVKISDSETRPAFKFNEMAAYTNSKFRDDEVTMLDTYLHTYMGKTYGFRATEVISMGIENFSSPALMKELFMAHPDLFETIVGLALT